MSRESDSAGVIPDGRSGKAAYAVLLRGVNVGGRAILPMATLREVLIGLGYDDVRTYLQSGNAVLTSSRKAEEVEADIQRALRERTEREIEAFVRSGAQLASIVERWPFEGDAVPTAKHVTFLRDAPGAVPLEGISFDGFEPERLVVDGGEIYMLLPNGIGRSKLAVEAGKRLKRIPVTTRNWNTVVALRDMTAAG